MNAILLALIKTYRYALSPWLGFGVFALGRCHAGIEQALRDAMALSLPNLVQMECAPLSGLLAEALVVPLFAALALTTALTAPALIIPMLTAKRIAMLGGVTAQQLGAAVGRETTAVVAVVDEALARGIRGAIASSAS